MEKLLIVSLLWLSGTHWAFGQCGSQHGTDLDGPYVSSTSGDQCSTGPRGVLADADAPSSRQLAFRSFVERGSTSAAPVIFVSHKYHPKFARSLILISRASQIADPPADCLQGPTLENISVVQHNSSAAQAVRGCYILTGAILRAALEVR